MKFLVRQVATSSRRGSRRNLSASAEQEARERRYRRLFVAAGLLGLAVLFSAGGYHVLGNGTWTWGDCLYMAAITLSTVGFGETLPGMDSHQLARTWTLVVIFMGSGTLLYFVSTLTALIVEGDLGGSLRLRRMRNRIDRLEGHVILCGAGRTGEHIIGELVSTAMPFVVVDVDRDRLEELDGEHGGRLLYIVGDVGDDDVLREAGIERASGLVAALPDDRDNLYATVSARSLNERVRIVAKSVSPAAEAKLRRSGADGVVSPYFIGGMRMVSEMVRPTVVKFLDNMLRDRERNLRIEEVLVPTGSPLDGLRLGRAGLRAWSDLLVMAVQEADGNYRYNPPADYVLSGESHLVVLAPAPVLHELRRGLLDGSYRPGDSPTPAG